MARNFNQFQSLIIKNVLILKRSRQHLCFIYLIPIIIYLLVTWQNDMIKESKKPYRTNFEGFPISEINLEYIKADNVFYYSPKKCHYCENIMKRLKKSLQAKNPGGQAVTLVALGSEREVEIKTSTLPLTDYICAITFADSLSGSRESVNPVDLKTKIRFPLRFRRAKWDDFVSGEQIAWNTLERTCLNVDCEEVSNTTSPYGTEGYGPEGFLFILAHLNKAIMTEALIITRKLPYYQETIWVPDVFMRRFSQIHTVTTKSNISIGETVPFIAMFMYLYAVFYLISKISSEKESMMKEVLLTSGMDRFIYWISWYLFGIILFLPISGLFLLMLFTSVTPNSPNLIQYYSFGIIGCLIGTHMLSNISFVILITSIFLSGRAATCVGIMTYVLTFVPVFIISMQKDVMTNFLWVFYMCLFSNTAFGLGFFIIDIMENAGESLSTGYFFRFPVLHRNMTMTIILTLMMVDVFLYLAIAFYLEAVFPGYGIPKKWHFLFTFWRRNVDKAFTMPFDMDMMFSTETVKMPTVALDEISLMNSKRKYILSNINLYIYENDLTVFYGQANSGTFELTSILSGLIPATSGSAWINDSNLKTELTDVRSYLGIYNGNQGFLYEELTFSEHIRLFTQMRGLGYYTAISEAEYYVELFKVHKIARQEVRLLTRMEKQLLALCLAYCAGPKTVILHNPCLNIDSTKLPLVYNLILSEKYGRTTIMTTSVMKQAYVLGDIVVVFEDGHVECSGTLKFIDELYGFGGYKLTMVKEEYCKEDILDTFVLDNLPQSKKYMTRKNYNSYRFPKSALGLSTKFFKLLRKSRTELGLKKYLVEIFTFEDFSSYLESVHQESVLNLNTPLLRVSTMNPKSSAFIFNQFAAMFERFYIIRKRAWEIFLLQGLLVIFMTLVMYITKQHTHQPPLTFDEKLFSGDPIILLYINETEVRFLPVGKLFDLKDRKISVKRNYNDTLNMNDYFLNMAKTKPADTNVNTLFGLDYACEEEVTCWFNGLTSIHTSALCVAQAYGLGDLGHITNHPLPSNFTLVLARHASDHFFAKRFSIMMGILVLLLMLLYSAFYINDRRCGFKKLQEVSGVYKMVYWICALIWDSATFILVMTIQFLALIMISIYKIDFDDLPFITIIHVAYCFPHHMELYFFSMLIDSPIGFLFIISVAWITGYAYLFLNRNSVTEMILTRVISLINPFSSLLYFYQNMIFRNRCKLLLADLEHLCLTHDLLFEEFAFQKSFKDSGLTCRQFICGPFRECCTIDHQIFSTHYKPIIALIISGFMYATLLALVELKPTYFLSYWRRTYTKCIGIPLRKVIKEFKNAEVVPDEDEPDISIDMQNKSFVIQNLVKFMGRGREKPIINNLTLHGFEGESTAFLSSGTEEISALFRIMIRDTPKDFGKVYVYGKDVDFNLLSSNDVRISPIEPMLHPKLSVRQTLKFICLVCGFGLQQTTSICNQLIVYYKLENSINERVQNLDMISCRILGNIVSLIGNPKLVLSQTPTEGLTREMKLLYWSHIRGLQNLGTNLLIETADLGECRLLTQMTAIISGGKLSKTGTLEEIESALANGYLVSVTMENVSRNKLLIIALEELYNIMRSYMRRKIEKSKLVVTYFQTMVFFVPETVPEHRIIQIMESGMHHLPMLDYFIEHNSLSAYYGASI